MELALFSAEFHGNLEGITLLLACGANINAVDGNLHDALMLTCSSQH